MVGHSQLDSELLNAADPNATPPKALLSPIDSPSDPQVTPRTNSGNSGLESAEEDSPCSPRTLAVEPQRGRKRRHNSTDNTVNEVARVCELVLHRL